MLKQHVSKIGGKKLLTLAIAATLVTSVLGIAMPTASAEPNVTNVGTGEGSIFYTAHRIPSSHWDPCFATTCDQGTGPGTWVWFVLFDDAGGIVTSGLANEDGVILQGLEVGRTYFLQPTDCVYPECGEPPHDVIFNNWEDCSTNQQRPFVIDSANTKSGAAYYRYHLHGESNEQVACFTSGSPSPPPQNNNPPQNNDNQPPQNNNDNPPQDNIQGDTGVANAGSFETGSVDPVFYFKMVGFLNNEFSATTIAAENGTEAAAEAIPSTNLSGKPLDSDPSLTYAEYNSLYEVIRADPLSASQTARAAVDAGIPWEHLSDMQKAYIILKVKGSSLDATLVDLALE